MVETTQKTTINLINVQISWKTREANSAEAIMTVVNGT